MRRSLPNIGERGGTRKEYAQRLVNATDSPDVKVKKNATRYFLIPLIGGIAIAVFILALSLSLQVDIQPVAFETVNVSGGPGIGNYDLFFALVDAEQKNGPSNGYVSLKIFDRNQTVLYQSEELIRSFHFSTYTNYTGGEPTVGYRWTVPIANVTAGSPLPGGLGTAELRFLALSGRQITTTIGIPIPVATP